MSTHTIRMPDLGEGIAEVELVAWHVQPGDTVTEDQVLADVMTDKASVEIPSPVHGTVLSLGGEVGELMAVGATLLSLEVSDAAGGPTPATTAASTPAAPAATQPAPESVPQPVNLTKAAAPVAQATTSPASTQRALASPAVRARAWELGIALDQVQASGTAGRIMQADLDRHLAQRPAAPQPAGATPPSRPPRATIAEDTPHTEKIIGLRRKIAQKMQDAKRRIPHFAYVEEIDVTAVEALRAQLNAAYAARRGHLTLLPLLARAIVLAVRAYPQVNAHFDDEAGVITRFGAVHLGVATQTDMGLMVPVLRNAQAGDLWANAAEVQRLAQAARSGKVARDEMLGSTLTLTSLGKLGGIMSTPIINHPEVAIVGVNRMVERAVIRDGAVVARQMMNLSSSFDHRVVDGAVAAAFIQCLRGHLEAPATLLVD
jgi:2-oxoisovalerate dehydrogenase E2 component (dihydrolipoyl transacylase)